MVEEVRRLVPDIARLGVEVRGLADHLHRIGRRPAVVDNRGADVRPPVGIAAVAAADMAVEDDRIRAQEGRHDIFAEIGGVPVDAGAAVAQIKGVARADIHALHRFQPGVGGLGREESHFAGQRTAGEVGGAAEGVVQTGRSVADRQLGGAGDGPDRVLDRDVEIVDCQ
ncbi:hypothetical protein D3C77_433720 [compost metagenome]